MAALAAAGLLSAVPAVTDTASPAQAAGEFTCRSTAALWQPLPDAPLMLHTHNEPESGVDSWENAREAGFGWPAATWAGPDGRMYYVRASDGTLQRHRWTGSGWEGNGESKTIAGGMGYWADKPGKVTVDSTGAFYLVDQNGELRRRTYDETTAVWNEVVIDGGWQNRDKIFAAGDGVLYGVTGGVLSRFHYHAGSQRWLQHNVVVNPRSGGVVLGYLWAHTATSPGADIIYGIQFDQLVWHRYDESTGLLSSGTRTGTWLSGDKTITASPDSCRPVSQPNPARPDLGPPDRLAKASLLKTSDGHLQYAYVDAEGRTVHGDIADLSPPGPAAFTTLPDPAAFTGTPAVAENAGGSLRVWAQGVDSDVRGFGRAAGSVRWDAALNRYGRMATPPQAVRTTDNRVAYYALDSDGQVWSKSQTQADGTLYPWRRVTSGPAMGFTRKFTATAVGNTVHLVVLRTAGDHCKITIVSGSVSPWTCGGTAATSAPAVVPMPDNTLQLFVRRSDGHVHTSRTTASGEINGPWTLAGPGVLPGGVQVAGDPAAVSAPDGTIQLVVRGNDGFVYRTGQVVSASTTWHPWSEVTSFAVESAVDPTVSLAGDTWVIAFRTTAAEPRLLRWVPTAHTAASSTVDSAAGTGAGEFVPVPLRR